MHRTALRLAVFVIMLVAPPRDSYAQGGPDVINMFGAIMRAAMVDHARTEWARLPHNELSCMDQALQKQGYSIDALVQRGIPPTDPRVSNIHIGCQTSTAPNTSLGNENTQNVHDLSNKPTFDCGKARTATAHVLCLDRAGAKADWDLSSAYWARSSTLAEDNRPGFDRAQEDWLESLYPTCRLMPQQTFFLPAQRQCVLAAYRNRTANYRSQLTGDALVESTLSPEEHVKVQELLISLGLLNGQADGEFGPLTRAAIRKWQAQSASSETGFLTEHQRRRLLDDNPTDVSAKASTGTICRTADPTGTPLNIRSAPDGKVARAIENGVQVRIVQTRQGADGHPWSLIERAGESRALGWAFRKYIDCSSSNNNARDNGPNSTTAKDTPQLKDARTFLEDAKKFIAEQQNVPEISEIAHQAASLQVALNNSDEAAAVVAVRKLRDLLTPIVGFAEFEQQQQAARKRMAARQLAEASNEAKTGVHFLDGFMKDHLGVPETTSLLALREKLSGALNESSIERLTAANNALASYIRSSGLEDDYKNAAKPEAPKPDVKKAEHPKTLGERLGIGPKSEILVKGPADEIVLLYNISPTAPSVWKNVRGEIVFQNEAATLCFAQANPDVGVVRFVEHKLGDLGARKVTNAETPCDLSRVASSVDIIAYQRGELLKNHEGYLIKLAQLLEGDKFRKYVVVSDYESELQKRQAFSLKIESDIEANSREGFGVIEVASSSSIACVIPTTPPDRADGLKELIKRNTDVIAPRLTSEWRFEDTTTDLAFRGLQRRQCGYLAGDASELRLIMLALRKEDQLKYAFSAVWWSSKEVDQAAFDVHDSIMQNKRKKALVEQAKRAEEDLEKARKKDKAAQKNEIERRLREENGVRARGLVGQIREWVEQLAEKHKSNAARLFPAFANWLANRFDDKWETFNTKSDVADFGTAQWHGRALDAIVVRSVIQQKNRILGRYEDKCYLFGMINDVEFKMYRDPLAADCDDKDAVTKWKLGGDFKSKWNAD